VIQGVIARHTQGRIFGLLGEARVNVLQMNLELQRVSAS
jgi:K+-transporting ATPase ATPase C chain